MVHRFIEKRMYVTIGFEHFSWEYDFPIFCKMVENSKKNTVISFSWK